MKIGTLVEVDTMEDGKLLAIMVKKWYSNKSHDPDLREFVYTFRFLDSGNKVSWGAKILKAFMKADVVKILSK